MPFAIRLGNMGKNQGADVQGTDGPKDFRRRFCPGIPACGRRQAIQHDEGDALRLNATEQGMGQVEERFRARLIVNIRRLQVWMSGGNGLHSPHMDIVAIFIVKVEWYAR